MLHIIIAFNICHQILRMTFFSYILILTFQGQLWSYTCVYSFLAYASFHVPFIILVLFLDIITVKNVCFVLMSLMAYHSKR